LILRLHVTRKKERHAHTACPLTIGFLILTLKNSAWCSSSTCPVGLRYIPCVGQPQLHTQVSVGNRVRYIFFSPRKIRAVRRAQRTDVSIRLASLSQTSASFRVSLAALNARQQETHRANEGVARVCHYAHVVDHSIDNNTRHCQQWSYKGGRDRLCNTRCKRGPHG